MTDRRGRVGAALAVAALFVGNTGAQTAPNTIGGYLGYTHLSNALGLADGAAVPVGPGYVSQADNVTTVALVAGLLAGRLDVSASTFGCHGQLSIQP